MKRPGYKTVLIAEDDHNDLVFMQMAFGQAGVPNPLQIVRNGDDAIAYLAGSGDFADRDRFPFPALMFLDLGMPGKSGFEVLSWWQKRGKSPDLRIVILSGSEQPIDIERAQALGAAGYRIKNTSYASWLALAREARDHWLAVESVDEKELPLPFYDYNSQARKEIFG